MKERFCNMSAVKLIATSAVCLVILFVATGAFQCARDYLNFKSGKSETVVLEYSDFVLSGMMETKENTYYTTDGDPQMIIDVGQNISQILITAHFKDHPGEMAVYYTKNIGEGFSAKRRVFFKAVHGQEDVYMADMGGKKIGTLRIDPTMKQDNEITAGQVVINPQISTGQYFTPGYKDFYNLIMYTAIISAVLKMTQELLKRDFE